MRRQEGTDLPTEADVDLAERRSRREYRQGFSQKRFMMHSNYAVYADGFRAVGALKECG